MANLTDLAPRSTRANMFEQMDELGVGTKATPAAPKKDPSQKRQNMSGLRRKAGESDSAFAARASDAAKRDDDEDDE